MGAVGVKGVTGGGGKKLRGRGATAAPLVQRPAQEDTVFARSPVIADDRHATRFGLSFHTKAQAMVKGDRTAVARRGGTPDHVTAAGAGLLEESLVQPAGEPALAAAGMHTNQVYVALSRLRLRDEADEKADHLAPVIQHEASVPEVPEKQR